MYTHLIKKSLIIFAVGAFTLALGSTPAAAADFSPAQTSNILDHNLDGTDLIDTINEQYPVNTAATIDDPRLLQPNVRSGVIIDRVDRYYPVDTGATIDDPRLLEPHLRSGVVIDRVDEYYPVDTSGNLEQTGGAIRNM